MIPGLGRSPGEGKGYPLHYSGLENAMDCIVHGVAKSRTQLSDLHSGRYVKELTNYWGFPSSSDGKVSACNAGNLGSIPGLIIPKATSAVPCSVVTIRTLAR